MSGKRFILILGALAVVSFGGSLAVSLLLGGRKPPPGKGAAAGKPASAPDALLAGLGASPSPQLLPTRRKLEELVKELRARAAEYERKEDRLAERESRVALAEQDLQRRAKELEKLRMELVGPLTRLKDAIAELERARIEVEKDERAGLQQAAATFDKMDAAKGGALLAMMCDNGQTDDAVKILTFMTERTRAKLLEGMPDPAKAAELTNMMKRIKQGG